MGLLPHSKHVRRVKQWTRQSALFRRVGGSKGQGEADWRLHAQMKTVFVFRWGQQIFRLVRLLFAQMAREMQGRVWSGSIRVSGLGGRCSSKIGRPHRDTMPRSLHFSSYPNHSASTHTVIRTTLAPSPFVSNIPALVYPPDPFTLLLQSPYLLFTQLPPL